MITDGATDITSQPSRIDGREQLFFSAAGASGAVRIVTSSCFAHSSRQGELRKKQQFVKKGYN